MEELKRKIIAACLAFKKHEYEFDYFTLPYVDCDICKIFRPKETEKRLPSSTSIQSFLINLAKHFSIRITFVWPEGKHSVGDGKELFIRQTPHNFIFHSNPGRICKLPAGVGKRDGCIFRIADILKGAGETKGALRQKDLAAIQNKNGIGFTIWTKTGRKPMIIRKCTKSKPIHLHLDSLTDTLFLISDLKLYLRGFICKHRDNI